MSDVEKLIHELGQARDLAMDRSVRARIPECGDFASIAQTLDAALPVIATLSTNQVTTPVQDGEVDAMVERLEREVVAGNEGKPPSTGDVVVLVNPDGPDAAALLKKLAALNTKPQVTTDLSGEVGEWQPFETAPKDGSYILVAGSNFDGGMAVVCWNDWWMLDDGKNFEIAMRHESQVTHWRPLPSGPALGGHQ